MYQLGDTIDIASQVVDVLTLVDSPCHPIYRFVGVDIGYFRSAPLKVFQKFKADILILLSRLVSISVECGEKPVKRGLSENPFAFGCDLRETHVLNTLKTATFWVNFLSLRTPYLIKVVKSSKHYKQFAC